MANDELFDKLYKRAEEILIELDKPIKQYHQTLHQLMVVDVSIDQDYRHNFAQFYRLGRRTQSWKDHYFALLEQSKHDPATNFADTLAQLKQRTNRIEPSFASKLVATIDPQQPVIDSIVLGVLDYRQPYFNHPDRSGELVKLHRVLSRRLQNMIIDPRFSDLNRRFRSMYPDYSFTDIKVLDFILWQLRESRTSPVQI